MYLELSGPLVYVAGTPDWTPDWTEQGRVSVAATADTRVTEALAAKLYNSGQDYETVQKNLTATLLEANQASNELMAKLAGSVGQLANRTDAQISTLSDTVLKLTGYVKTMSMHIQEEVTAAVLSAVSEHGFNEFSEVDIERFRKILDDRGEKEVEWDGIVACERGELRLLVLVEAKSYLKEEHLKDTKAYKRVMRTKAFLDRIANADRHEPPQDAHGRFKQQWRFYQDVYINRKLVLAIGSPSMVAGLADKALRDHCIVARTEVEGYEVQGLEESHMPTRLLCEGTMSE